MIPRRHGTTLSTEIYYFTGTGNSLAVARDITEETSGRLISIPSMMEKKSITTDADAVGIIFPAYYMRIPRIVERFIGKLTDLQGKYIFAIVTVGGIAGSILWRLSEEIGQRRGNLAAGFVVRMPANYIDSADALPLFLQKRMFRKWQRKANEITEDILNRKTGIEKRFNPIMTFLFSKSIDKQFAAGELDPDIDRNFWTDDKCNGCGICPKVCPVGNVKIIDDKPAWQNNCEKCLACIQWCPKEAIQFKNVTIKRKRYHHPDVEIKEVLKRE